MAHVRAASAGKLLHEPLASRHGAPDLDGGRGRAWPVRTQYAAGAFHFDRVWTVTAPIGLLFYVTVRLLAKRTRLLRSRPS